MRAAIVVVLLLIGCAPPAPETPRATPSTDVYPLSRGYRTLELVHLRDGTRCVVAHAPDAVSVVCDWSKP